MKEGPVSKAIRLQLNRSGRVRLLNNEVGFIDGRGRYGLGNGSPDLVGVLRNGRAFCIEVKKPVLKSRAWWQASREVLIEGGAPLLTGRTMPKSTVRPDQFLWWTAARGWKVLGGVAHSVEEAFQLLSLAESMADRPPGRRPLLGRSEESGVLGDRGEPISEDACTPTP